MEVLSAQRSASDDERTGNSALMRKEPDRSTGAIAGCPSLLPNVPIPQSTHEQNTPPRQQLLRLLKSPPSLAVRRVRKRKHQQRLAEKLLRLHTGRSSGR
jgi:hypothetical protein